MESVREKIRGAGVGLKAQHYGTILEETPDIGWFEIHPENYMGAGGPPHAYLEKIRERYPLSVHGVGLSIGGAEPLDQDHLDRLKQVVDRYQPDLVSEHLAWSTHQGQFYNDLLALPYTKETLGYVADHVNQVQDHLGRTILLENPATYITFENSTIDEIDFIKEVAAKTGCSLLLDVNNVYVSCTNHDRDMEEYINRFPVEWVGEIHLAGHAQDQDANGHPLLIDSHDRPVIEEVWALYQKVLQRKGTVATLIEWDSDIPDWPVLFGEAQKAQGILDHVGAMQDVNHVA